MKILKRVVIFLLLIFSFFLILDFIFPLDVDRLNKPQSKVIYDNKDRLLYIGLSKDGFLRVPLEGKIPINIKKALLSYEDRYFYYHFGVNPISIFRAIVFNSKNNRKIGASTITMQVARMINRYPRTIKYKIIEIFRALQLEWHYSKDDILRFYLNNAPFGGNIEGLKTASLLYFNLEVNKLSIAQSAYLISIPKNPIKNRPKNIDRVQSLKEKVLKAMREVNNISKKQYILSMNERIYPYRRNLTNIIPIYQRYFDYKTIKSSINKDYQEFLRTLLLKRLKELKKLRIYNASAILIDNKSLNTLAYIGSASFFEANEHSNKVDGIKAIISPGSSLKPFIYAKAFDIGYITAKKRVFDIPYSRYGYMPKNYEGKYLGEITASEALAYSRNIPAIELNRMLNKNSLYYILKEAKIKSIKNNNIYGDSIAVGGLGITLQDIARLYTSFANSGVYKDGSFSKQLFSKEAAWLTLNILSNAPRLRLNSSWEFAKNKSKIAFKTGTSAHALDMLSIGVTPKYTLAIWFGNFDRKNGVNSFDYRRNGLKVATPVMFSFFDYLNDKSSFKKPKNIIKKRICLDAIKVSKCKIKDYDYLIKTINIYEPCSILTPQTLLKLIKSNKIKSFSNLKNHHCYNEWKSYKPQIEGVSNNRIYIKNKLLPKELKKIKLTCYSYEENNTIFWFIDNEEPISSQSAKPLYKYLKPGHHKIKCLDMGSKESSVEFEVKEI